MTDYDGNPGDPTVDRSDFEAVFADLPRHGWLKADEARLLWDAARSTEGTLVEFGTYHGRSLCLLASLGRPVVAVDPYDDPKHGDGAWNERMMRGNLERRGLSGRVTVARARVEDWAPVEAGLVYVDGDHSYEGTYRAIAKALACRPSVVAVHDVDDVVPGKNQPIVKAALQALGPWDGKASTLAVWDLRKRV